MIFAIDFDGVIHDSKNPIEGKRMGPLIAGAKEALIELKRQDHTIIIHSVWAGHKEDGPNIIKEYMDYYELPYDDVTAIKPRADAYLDDRAIRFYNWTQALEDIYKLCM